jgi:hypothetical protein
MLARSRVDEIHQGPREQRDSNYGRDPMQAVLRNQ